MSKSKKFISNFNLEEQKKLKAFFDNLNNAINLTPKDRKLFVNDFENAILFYFQRKESLDTILNKLNLSNINDFYKINSNNWYSLDYAAKIYPLSMKKNFMAVFRVSAYLEDNIIPEILQMALNFTVKRFPSFATTVRKGFFWHYLDGIKRRFKIYPENEIPCSKINISNLTKRSFKTLYYNNRISVEFFHVLTDGYGGLVFLKTLVAEYLHLLGSRIVYSDTILNINDTPSKQEINNDFILYKKSTKKEGFKDKLALQLDGKLSLFKPCQILHFELNCKEIKNYCHQKDITITNLLLGFIFMACKYSASKDGTIKIQIPVNLRNYYNSKTLRNFSLYSVISINRNDINDFDKLLLNIKMQMAEKTNKEKMNNTMVHTNRLINSIKFIPLIIKRPIAKLIYGFLGDKVFTTVLSNLGEVKYPKEINPLIKKMDFVLGTSNINRCLFSAITCNNVLTLSITKLTTNSAVENNLYNLIKSENFTIKVTGSGVYENK